MTETDPIVTIDDLRATNLCMGGGRRTAARVGLSWNHFIEHGYPASQLAALDDGLINRVVQQAYKRVGHK